MGTGGATSLKPPGSNCQLSMHHFSALAIAIMGIIYVHGRLNNLERKLKDYDVIPKEFDSIPKEFNSIKELDKEPPSQD